MLKKITRIALFSFLWCVIVSAVWAQEFRFTCTADSRGSSGFSDVLNQIINLVGSEGAFHIIPGDFDPPSETFSDLRSAFGNDMIWIPVMGNHDLGDKSWVKSHNQTLPFDINWGPRSCDLRTTFSFDYSNAHFVILDEYCEHSGDIDDGLYDWLSADLSATDQPAIFVFGHEPAYPFDRHVGNSLDAYRDNRDRFWQLLHDTGVVAYICGHTHNPSAYQRQGYDPWQIDCGQARGTGSHDAFVDVTVRDGEVELKVYRGGSNPFSLWWNRIVPIVPLGPPYSLTVDTQGLGSVAVSPPGGSYDEGTEVTLTASASTGWIFDHWEGDLSGFFNSETITMDRDKAVTAIFIMDAMQMPVASFTANPSSGDAPLFVVFDASASHDPDGFIDSYAWNFGDGGDAFGVSANHEYNTPGIYTVTLTVTDNVGINNTATQTVTVGGEELIEVRVSASSDDAEERSSGSMYLTSSDLELVYDGGNQKVGMRFNGVTIPQRAAITNAYIQFQVDETNSGATYLTIEGQYIGNAPTFSSSSGNISSRVRTTATVSWDPVPWTRTGEAGPDQQTPNIAGIIQEIVNLSDWSSGNSLVIIISGTGERTAESYNGVASAAPLLHVEYFTSGQTPVDQPPSASIDSPDNGSTVSGIVTIKVDASDAEDPVGSLDVEVQIDDGPWQLATYNSTSGRYELSWNTDAESSGSHTIDFRATDSSGNTTNGSQVMVTVPAQSPPVAEFVGSPVSGDAPLAVSFTDKSSGGVTSYSWDFGDGNTSTLQNPSHTYTVADTCTVSLTVTGPGGSDIETKIDCITVTQASGPTTVSLQDGVNGYSGTRDTKLLSTSPSTNYGSAVELEVDGSPDYSVLLSWDLTSIPLGSTIESVAITLEITNYSSHMYEFYEMKRPWVESEARWNEYALGQSWQVSGADGSADRGSTVLGGITGSTGTRTISLNAAGIALVQSWVDGPSSNHGFILVDYINASNGLDFFSRETATPTDRPKLTVTYFWAPPIAKIGFDHITTSQLQRLAEDVPDKFELKGNYPNPFNASTVITYALPEAVEVHLTVYDVLGRQVVLLVDDRQHVGQHNFVFDANGLSTGMYFMHIQAGRFNKTHKMVLIK